MSEQLRDRRALVWALTALPLAASVVAAPARTIVMLHGAFAGAWTFRRFKPVFQGLGWQVEAPDLIHHGADKANGAHLAGVSLSRFTAQMARYVEQLGTRPVLLGHSMGCVIAQELAARGLAKAQQRAVFNEFGTESGQALFELFFWMLHTGNATRVDTEKIHCPVLCVRGTDDRVVSAGTTRPTAAAYQGAAVWEEPDHGHMLLIEPGAEAIARRIARWAGRVVR